MFQTLILAAVLSVPLLGFGDRHVCSKEDEFLLRRQRLERSARNLDRTLGRKPGFVPIRPKQDIQEWKAIKDMFVVQHGNDLGVGRDTNGWSQRWGSYDNLQIVTALRLNYTDEAKSDYEQQKAELLKELHTNSKAFGRIHGLKTRKSRRLVRFLRKYNIKLRPAINEVLLLHATKDDNVLNILDNGLTDFRCRSWWCSDCDKSLFGCGVYLADEIEKVDQYATPVKQNMIGHASNTTTINAVARNQRDDDGLKWFMQHHNQNIFYAFIVKALLGKTKTIVKNQRQLDFSNGYFQDYEDHYFTRTWHKYHSQFMPSQRTNRTGGILERYNEVTADALGRRTEILYVVAYTRCKNNVANAEKCYWTCDKSAKTLESYRAMSPFVLLKFRFSQFSSPLRKCAARPPTNSPRITNPLASFSNRFSPKTCTEIATLIPVTQQSTND